MWPNGPQVDEGGYAQTLKQRTDMEDETNTPNEEQTGRLPQPVVSESLLREAIYLLSVKQPESCPGWIYNKGDCGRAECEFCRFQACIEALESNVR